MGAGVLAVPRLLGGICKYHLIRDETVQQLIRSLLILYTTTGRNGHLHARDESDHALGPIVLFLIHVSLVFIPRAPRQQGEKRACPAETMHLASRPRSPPVLS